MDQVLMLMKVWQLNNESFFFIALVLICNVVMRMVGFIADCNDWEMPIDGKLALPDMGQGQTKRYLSRLNRPNNSFARTWLLGTNTCPYHKGGTWDWFETTRGGVDGKQEGITLKNSKEQNFRSVLHPHSTAIWSQEVWEAEQKNTLVKSKFTKRIRHWELKVKLYKCYTKLWYPYCFNWNISCLKFCGCVEKTLPETQWTQGIESIHWSILVQLKLCQIDFS